ncbi:MAG: LacI family DNA-binding transcriptional regulator [Pseudomonadota bacterium]
MKKPGGSIRDVATETGLSIATISRVMNNNSNVSPKTRQRVLDACEKLDYLPNPAARALSTSKSKTVAAIIPTLEHSVFAKFTAAIERALAKQGYSLVLAVSNADEEEELKSARKLLGMGAEAFILSGTAHCPTLLETFERRQVPHVFTSVWDPDNPVATIGYDNAELARNAVQYLASLGHQEIGILHGPLAESDRTVARRQGAETVTSANMQLSFFETQLSVSGGKTATTEMLSRNLGCTALLCFSDVLALGAYFGLAEAGMTVPRDMSVMGFDNLDWASETVPPLTTIDLPAYDMGRAVAEEIIDYLERGVPLQKQLLSAQIIKRASVAKIN